MIATKPMSAAAQNDAELVHASLAGNCEAFGRIVARYQALICSLAYSATGSLSRSEELAQDTFVAAWKQLAALREPAKLRAWLCGIARHVISNAQRRAGREPAHLAEPFDPAHEAVATEPSPPEQAVSQEEAALLWRALEKIPENYREPLVLFYREQKSVENVARELELSEDAVKQRLSRGRALLHEQVLALVEGTLARSNPGQAFTLNVVAALPAVSAGIATAVGAASATKSSTAAKAASSAGGVGVTAVVFGLLAALGGYIGWQMGDAQAQSPSERAWVGRFWRLVVVGFVGCLLPAFALLVARRRYPWLLDVATLWLGLFYAVVATGFAMFAWRQHQRIRRHVPAGGPALALPRSRLTTWVALGTLGMAALLAFTLYDMQGWRTERLSPAAATALIAAHPEAQFCILEYENGHRTFMAFTRENSGRVRYSAVLDESVLAALKKSGVAYRTSVQGRDFELLGWPGRYLLVLAVVIMAAGIVTLARTLKRGKPTSAPAAPANPAGN